MRAGVPQTLQCRCMPNKIAVAASFVPGFFTDGVVVNSGDRTVDSAHLRLTYSSIDPTDVLQSALQLRIFPFRPTQHNLRVLCGAGPYASLRVCRSLQYKAKSGN
jgi:hypothetical protein